MWHNYSEACARNQQPIFKVLQYYLAPGQQVLEVGSGSGQHAVHFVSNLTGLTWQPSELEENIPSLATNIATYNLPGIAKPVALDVLKTTVLPAAYDVLYTANTLHIMSWPAVRQLVELAGKFLPQDGLMIVYGPFKYQNAYTSSSNAAFDQWLKQRDPHSGIRDFEALEAEANAVGLQLLKDWDMPANNQCLVWQKRS
ncbi:DUF938 domain-containing protein [Pontibacter sp. JAM-7]|uniref:DUF938 domain-containing protein n=1 Tax=Pontibacter sp. JAM-7 TaxID=3366581 RepID=UPI003AF6E5E0